MESMDYRDCVRLKCIGDEQAVAKAIWPCQGRDSDGIGEHVQVRGECMVKGECMVRVECMVRDECITFGGVCVASNNSDFLDARFLQWQRVSVVFEQHQTLIRRLSGQALVLGRVHDLFAHSG